MAKSIIVDSQGNPLEKTSLSTPISEAQITGIRNIWQYASQAQWLTPENLATILRQAAAGDADAYLTLAEEAEEKDLHYASVLGTRKRAVSGLPIVVEAASDSAEHVKHADFIRDAIRQPEFLDARDDLLDALGKGYSVVELNYDTRKTPWLPKNRWGEKPNGEWGEIEGFAWRDPRFFMFDRITGRELRIKDERNLLDGLPLPRYRFLVHKPRLKTGIPIRGGLARLVIAGLMCKWYTLTDWMAFAEVFGMPLRVGKYGANATADDIATLVAAVANIGSDAAAAIPDSMRIEFESPGNTAGGAELFKNLAEWLDKQISKAVLGQTASSEGTAGKLGNDELQSEVRSDILASDAKQIDNTLNRDFVRALIDLNFGEQEQYPQLCHQIIEPEDLTGLVNALNVLVPMGMKVEASWARDKIGAPEPEDGAELLQAPSTATMALNRQLRQASNRQQSHEDLLDDIAQDMLADWQEQIAPELAPIYALVEQASSPQELSQALADLLDKDPNGTLVNALSSALFRAHGLGNGNA